MSAFPTDILIAKSGGRTALDKTAWRAKVLLAKNVLNRIAAPDRPAQKYTIPTQLVRRESSGPPLKFSARTPGFSESSITNA